MSTEKTESLTTIRRIFAFGMSDIIMKISNLKLKPQNSLSGLLNTMKATQKILAPN